MIRFLMILQNFETYVVTTPFAETWQLQQWLNGMSGSAAKEFIDDPIANLPSRSFVNFVVGEEDLANYSESVLPNDPMVKHCHGTLMVDDNKSIFYSETKRNADWKLPYCIFKD